MKEISQGAQISQIGAEDNGIIRQVVARDAIVVVVEHLGIEEEVEEDEDAISVDMIHWLVASMGGMGIWLVTILALVTHQQVVVALAPLEEVR